MLKFLLYLIIIYYCVRLLFRFLTPFIIKKIFSSFSERSDLFNKDSNLKKHKSGDTEVSYKKNKSVDPGGEYVDFEEEINNDQ